MSKAIMFKLKDGTVITVEALSDAEIALLRDIGERSKPYAGWLSISALADVRRQADIVAPTFRQRAGALLEALGRKAIASLTEG